MHVADNGFEMKFESWATVLICKNDNLPTSFNSYESYNCIK